MQGGRTFQAPANQSTAFDWQSLRTRPKAVSLAMAAPADCLSPEREASFVEPTQLQSQMISLERGTEQQLHFVCATRSDDAFGQVLLACQVENRAAQGVNRYLYIIRKLMYTIDAVSLPSPIYTEHIQLDSRLCIQLQVGQIVWCFNAN